MQFIAKENNRSLSKEVEYLYKKHIYAYENEHGPIILLATLQEPDSTDEQS